MQRTAQAGTGAAVRSIRLGGDGAVAAATAAAAAEPTEVHSWRPRCGWAGQREGAYGVTPPYFDTLGSPRCAD